MSIKSFRKIDMKSQDFRDFFYQLLRGVQLTMPPRQFLLKQATRMKPVALSLKQLRCMFFPNFGKEEHFAAELAMRATDSTRVWFFDSPPQ
jgi:hypothetical protein